MLFLSFSWDENKNQLNSKKHKVSFKEAQTVFYDDKALEFYDIDHSENEDRYLLLGLSNRLRVLVVSFCFIKKTAIIRIISARKAAKKESEYYCGGEI